MPRAQSARGDQVVVRVGGARITFDVLEMRPPRHLMLDVQLPLGVTIHEHIQITPIDAHSSRLTFT